jgi:hypothetical protein
MDNNEIVVGSFDGRRAVIYRSTHPGDRGSWLVRFELYPQHHQPLSGWYGGRADIGTRYERPEAAEAVARTWVDKGELPESL